MFTLVVSLVVVAASVAAVLRLALAEPGQPATDQRPSRRERAEARAAQRALAPRPEAKRKRKERPARPAQPPPRKGDAAVSAAVAIDLDRVGALRRIRSGLALLLLLAFVGALLAAVIGTLLFMAGLALRNAVS